MPCARFRGPLAPTAAVALAIAACAPAAPPDGLAGRCADVLALEHFALERTEWRVVSRRGSERTLHFEAVRRPDGAPVSDAIRCVFAPVKPWRLERGVVGGRILSDTEIALVNADLLLRDLGGSPAGGETAPDAS